MLPQSAVDDIERMVSVETAQMIHRDGLTQESVLSLLKSGISAETIVDLTDLFRTTSTDKLREVLPSNVVDKLSKIISPELLSKIARNGGIDDDIASNLLRDGLSPDLIAKLEDIDFTSDV